MCDSISLLIYDLQDDLFSVADGQVLSRHYFDEFSRRFYQKSQTTILCLFFHHVNDEVFKVFERHQNAQDTH